MQKKKLVNVTQNYSSIKAIWTKFSVFPLHLLSLFPIVLALFSGRLFLLCFNEYSACSKKAASFLVLHDYVTFNGTAVLLADCYTQVSSEVLGPMFNMPPSLKQNFAHGQGPVCSLSGQVFGTSPILNLERNNPKDKS